MTDGKIYHFKSDNYPFSVFVGICDICGSLDRMNTFRRALDAEMRAATFDGIGKETKLHREEITLDDERIYSICNVKWYFVIRIL